MPLFEELNIFIKYESQRDYFDFDAESSRNCRFRRTAREKYHITEFFTLRPESSCKRLCFLREIESPMLYVTNVFHEALV